MSQQSEMQSSPDTYVLPAGETKITFDDFIAAKNACRRLTRAMIVDGKMVDASMCVLAINQSNAESSQWYVIGLLLIDLSFQGFQLLFEKEDGFDEGDVLTIFDPQRIVSKSLA